MSDQYPPAVPPSPVGAPADGSRVRPSFGWVLLAVVLLIAGPGGCGVAWAVEVVGLVDGFDEFGSYRLPVEGAALTFDEPVDRVTLYLRGRRSSDARLLGDVTVTAPDGEPVTLFLPRSEFTFDHPDGGVLTSVFEFSADQAGTYRLTAEVAPEGEGTELTAGRELLASVGPTVAVAFALGALCALVGLVLLIVVLVRRGRSRRELRGPPPGWVGPPPPAGWTGVPPGGPPPWGTPGPPRPGWGAPPPGWGEPSPPAEGDGPSAPPPAQPAPTPPPESGPPPSAPPPSGSPPLPRAGMHPGDAAS